VKEKKPRNEAPNQQSGIKQGCSAEKRVSEKQQRRRGGFLKRAKNREKNKDCGKN